MKTIRLRNYRCFEDTGSISLKPLNFLVGTNSSGKSSFLEFFPLFQQSMRINRDGVFLWVGGNVDANDFRTVVRNGTGTIGVEFEIGAIPLSVNYVTERQLNLNDVKIVLEIVEADYGDSISYVAIHFNQQKIELRLHDEENDEIIINGETMSAENEKISHGLTNSLLPKIFFGTDTMDFTSSKRNKELYTWARQNFKDEKSSFPFPFFFRLKNILNKGDFRNKIVRYIKDESVLRNYDHIYNLAILSNLNEIIDVVNYYMIEQADKIEFIRPLRATAERFYRKRNISVNRISPNGDNIAMFLQKIKNEHELANFNSWLQENSMEFSVDLNEDAGFVEVKITEEGKEEKNLVDVGFGYSQILPILATIWKDLYYEYHNPNRITYCKTSLILIEQPELHLHPRFQKKFAELLVKCVNKAVKSNFDIRFIIETHSQDIINGFGLSVAYGVMDASLVNVLIFNAQHENMKNYIENASFNNKGFLENWPVGFFD